jgi:hypothetical protein
VFSLRGRFPPSSLATAKAKYSACNTTPFPPIAYGTITLYCVAFQPTSAMGGLGCKRCKHTPHLYCIAAAIRFGLFRFRSPLLTVSQLISFPLGTQMFPFPKFTFPLGNRRKPEGILLRSRIRASSDQQMHALTRGISQLATPFIVFQAKPSTKQRQRVG